MDVEALLASHDAAGSFMQATSAWDSPTSAMEPLAEGAGTVIGPYKLMQAIGEGGMGAVFMEDDRRRFQFTGVPSQIWEGLDFILLVPVPELAPTSTVHSCARRSPTSMKRASRK